MGPRTLLGPALELEVRLPRACSNACRVPTNLGRRENQNYCLTRFEHLVFKYYQICRGRISLLGKRGGVVEKRVISSLVVLCCLILLAGGISLRAQGIFATLTGTVTDPSGSVVTDAKVALRDAVSGSARDTVTNGEGYFTLASVPVGTYSLTVEA